MIRLSTALFLLLVSSSQWNKRFKEKKGGGGKQFLKFLVEDVRDNLSKKYRMAADDHTLFGNSAGGSFCVYTLLSMPEAFTKYVCGSAPLNAGYHQLFTLEERLAERYDDIKARQSYEWFAKTQFTLTALSP